MTYKPDIAEKRRAHEASCKQTPGRDKEKIIQRSRQEGSSKTTNTSGRWSIHQLSQHAALASSSAEAFAQMEYINLVRRTRGSHKVAEVQSHTVFDYEDSILIIVTIDWLTPVQKSPKDAKQRTSTDNGSPATIASTPNQARNDAKWGKNDKKGRRLLGRLHLDSCSKNGRDTYMVCW